MKRLILIILIMQVILCPVMAYQSSVYGSSRVAGTEYRKIGYTTNYANGQFNPSCYNGRITNQYGIYQTATSGYYGGTYNPSENPGSGIPGGPRRITVYNGNGKTEETPGGKRDGENWLYRYDEATREWWCSEDDGITWKKWDSLWGWGLLGFTWREDRGDPTENSSKWAHDPNDPFLDPIPSPIIPFSILAIGYVIYKKKEEKTC